MIGVIGGSGLLSSAAFAALDARTESTEFGDVRVRVGGGVVFCQRHEAAAEREYSQPRDVPYAGIARAFQQLGVTRVLAVYSVGSLRESVAPGSLVVAADFYNPSHILRLSPDASAHVVPELDAALRQTVLSALGAAGVAPAMDDAVYVQTAGPRFETKAEIRALRPVGHVVGMTGGNEAEAFCELGTPFAMLCMVDNFCNGVGEGLTVQRFRDGQRDNRTSLEYAVAAVVDRLRSSESPSVDQTPPDAREPADLVVRAGYVVPVAADGAPGAVLEDHAVVVRDGRIVAIVPGAEAAARFAARRTRHLPQHALTPGLVNAHTHAPMSVMRGFADDKALAEWLTEDVWPAEGRAMSAAFVRDGTRHAAAEMIKGGSVCFADMYFFPDAAVEALQEAGLRAVVGLVALGMPTPSVPDGDYVGAARAALARLRAASPLVRFAVAPHSLYACPEATVRDCVALANEEGLVLHTHLHEAPAEVADSVSGEASMMRMQSDRRCRPFALLREMAPNQLLAAHMVHADEADVAGLAALGASVAHCPTSNLKLACGECPVAAMLAAGVNVAIGTDGCCSNNTLDMVSEMKLAAVLAKGSSGDPTAVPAAQALRMATLNGAIALGLADETGSLEVGKSADMVAWRTDTVEMQPVYSIVSQIVYAASRDHVTHSWVAGRCLMDDRVLQTLDEAAVIGSLREHVERVRG